MYQIFHPNFSAKPQFPVLKELIPGTAHQKQFFPTLLRDEFSRAIDAELAPQNTLMTVV